MPSKQFEENNVYSLSTLSKKAGVGRILTWRRIVKRPQFAKLFKIVHETQRGIYVQTNLSTQGLIETYKKHLEYVAEENRIAGMRGVMVRISNGLKRQSEAATI